MSDYEFKKCFSFNTALKILYLFSTAFSRDSISLDFYIPAISPDASNYYFSYDSDLWKVSVDEGTEQ